MGLEDVSLAFNSFDDVSAHIMRSRPMKEAIVDETYPHTNEAQLMWVKAIYKALLNGADTIDGDKLIKQWESMIAENKVNIELVAWKTLVSISFNWLNICLLQLTETCDVISHLGRQAGARQYRDQKVSILG